MRLLTALLAATFALAADGWVQLLPAGEFAARDGRPAPGKKWNLSDAQGEALAAAFNATAKQTPIVIDYDHQTLHLQQHGQKAPAAGWMERAEWRNGQGLFAQTKWTAAAAQHIEQGEYRFISPVLMYDEKTLEVRGVAMAALVNYPALLGMSPVLAQLATQFQQEQPTMNPILAALLAGLGLAETATQAEATAALSALQLRADKPAAIPAALATALKLPATANEAAALAAVTALTSTDTAGLQAMAALQGQVAELTARLNEDTVTKTVDAAIAACKLTPAQRDWALGLGKKDMAALSGYIASAPVMDLKSQTQGKGPGEGGLVADALSAQVASQFGLTPEQMAKGKPATA